MRLRRSFHTPSGSLSTRDPSKGEREKGGGQERPLHRSAHDEEGEHGEKDNDCAHIDRSDSHGLVAPILRHTGQITAAGGLLQLRGVLVEVVVAFEVFDAFAVHNALRTAAFEVGHEEGERLVHAIAPLRDVVALQSAGGRFAIGGLRLRGEFSLSTHRLFGVFPRVVEVGEVDERTEQSAHHHSGSGFAPMAQRSLSHCVNAIGHDDEEHREEEIVGHLDVVAQHLQGGEQPRDNQSPEVFAAIGEHQSGDGGRDEGEGIDLPNVSCRDDNQKVGRERPRRSAKRREQRPKAEGAHEQIEPEEVEKKVGERTGGEQAHDASHPAEGFGRAVSRCNLVGGHPRKDTVRPARTFARGFIEGRLFLPLPHTGHRIVTTEHKPVQNGRGKIEETQQKKRQHDQHIRP